MATKVIYCLNAVIFYLRIMKVYTASSSLGPKLVMIKRMVGKTVFNLGNFKAGHFHLISDENKTLLNFSPFT